MRRDASKMKIDKAREDDEIQMERIRDFVSGRVCGWNSELCRCWRGIQTG